MTAPAAPPTPKSPLELLRGGTVREVAEHVRQRRVSARDMVDACIAEVERVNPTLNAVVATRFDEARAEAEAADERTRVSAPEDLPPLHGVPCTIKECFALVGMPQTSGLPARVGFRPSEDAPAVARLRAAGAIPVGVTNVSELCMWMESFNRVYGRTNNPYDPSRIVGGSSGGEGAIVGSGASLFGLGSDVGGSIRMPAFFNGVFGHKCSAGLIPNSGQYPDGDGDAGRFLSTGPLARSAGDLSLVVRLLAGPHESDPNTQALSLGDPAAVDITSLRVLQVPDDGRTYVSPALRASQARVADHLRARGCRVEERRFTRLRKAFDIWSSMLHDAQGTPFATLLADGKEFASLPELAKLALRRSDHTLPAVVLAVGERITDLAPGRTRALVEQGRRLRAELDEALANDTIMLYPPYGMVAPKHDVPLLWPFLWVYTAILNVMQLPVTQVPLGLDTRGLPLGVQVAAAHGNDHLTLAVAAELERAFGGWVRPRI
ncbi:MAG: amidase [Sandaracinaceae bacterium]|nr:amidase [Sandaracinaceae bacterium]